MIIDEAGIVTIIMLAGLAVIVYFLWRDYQRSCRIMDAKLNFMMKSAEARRAKFIREMERIDKEMKDKEEGDKP